MARTLDDFGAIVGQSGEAIALLDSTAVLDLEGGAAVTGQIRSAGTIHVVAGSVTVSGIDNSGLLDGAGTLKADKAALAITNEAVGVIDAAGPAQLALTLGAAPLANAGLIECRGAGGLIITGAIDNTGVLEAISGTLRVTGGVTGAGKAKIVGGVLSIGGALAETVTFFKSGTLALGQSTAFTGTVAGFSATGTTSFDLADVKFVGAGEASFSGGKTGGVLTVSDGAHVAHIKMAGDYLSATFVCGSDGTGGVLVKATGGLAEGRQRRSPRRWRGSRRRRRASRGRRPPANRPPRRCSPTAISGQFRAHRPAGARANATERNQTHAVATPAAAPPV